MLFLSCNPTANYHPVKKSHEDAKTANTDKSNEDSMKDSSSDDDSSGNTETKDDSTGGDDTSGNPADDNDDDKDEEGEEEDNKDDDGMDDNQQPPVKLTEVNYKAPAPYTYPNDYNDPNSSSLPKRHMLVWQDTPSSEVVVNWGVDEFNAGQEHMVFLSETQQNGIDPDNNYELKFAATESGLVTRIGNIDPPCDGANDSNIQVKVTGLKPNTTYYYITRSNGQKSKEMHFVTAPSDTEVSFKLLSGGDSRSQIGQRQMMNDVMNSMVTADPQYIALVHGGDFINTGSSCEQWRNWRNDHQRTILENGRIIPVVATFGNHESTGTDGEGEKIYNAIFGDPRAEGTFYFLSTIGNLSLIILNSEISALGDQQEWLQGTLETLKNKENHLIVAGYHAPAWPANKSPARTTAWVDEFQNYQVNLVLESDGHTLKQTCPIFVFGNLDDDEYNCDVDKGIIYVGEGGLGVNQREAVRANRAYFNPDFGGYATSQLHVQSLSVTSTGNEPSKLIYEVVFPDSTFNHKIELMSKDRKQLGNN